jgi:hypothetical protein
MKVALFALGCFCALAPGASASSTLLSGYGGPGEGNQAILGSTLIGGSGHSGSGGGGSAGGGSSAPQAASIEAAPASRPTPRTSGASRGGGASGARSQQRRTAHPRAAVPSTSAASGETATQVAVRPVSAPALGLSGTDVAYVVFAFLVLVLTAVVTVLLTRGEKQSQGGRGEIDIR